MSAGPLEPSSSHVKTPWYMPTPGKYLVLMLLTQVLFIALANYLFFKKGEPVLFTLGLTALSVFLLAGWLLVQRFRDAKAQFGLSALLLLIVVAAIPCAWLAQAFDQSRRDRGFIEVVAERAEVSFYDAPSNGREDPRIPLLPLGWRAFLISALGSDFFDEVYEVRISKKTAHDDDLETMARLPRLRSIRLWDPSITDAGLAHLKGLRRLRVIWCPTRSPKGEPPSITDAGLAHLKDLTELETVYLGNTSISDAGVVALGGLTKLEEVGFERSAISDAGLENLARNPKLIELGLSASQVTDAGLKKLKGLTKLQKLELGNTTVTDVGMSHLKEITGLRLLDLERTAITDTGLAQIFNLTQLDTLILAKTKVSSQGLEHVAGCVEITHLDLSGTGITDVGIKKIQRFAKLKYLVLDDTAITDSALEQLNGLTSLTLVSIERTGVTEGGVARFRSAVPGCFLIEPSFERRSWSLEDLFLPFVQPLRPQ